ncbi:D-amino-acid dehydrogenase [Lipingzhangella halophila]|uniref:D-amino-acid dehydrogenase n=1 Tax=Lipingzhangella halophila TaxID=1783352 RepID=A0A7W7RH59_9ACTN|nr:FAD-binding oxidoreductase [Lipingzhangella halophila]MBB4931907.1 D-amino-acid dehydrogenase [Lipingzhangella halophila]
MRVIVVGGGIVGASAAFHLASKGVSTTLVDRGHPGQATAAGAGIVFPWPFPWSTPQLREFQLRAAAHYPALMADLAADGETTGYDVVGGLSVSTDTSAADRDFELVRSLAAEPGYEGLGEVARLAPGEPTRRFPLLPPDYQGTSVAGMARVDGRQASAALVNAAEKRGIRRLNADAELIGEQGRVRGVRVGGEEHPADAVIVAGGAWSARLLAPFGVRVPVFPVRGQITHFAAPGQLTRDWPCVRLGERDHYLLTFPPNRIVTGGTREPEAGFDYRVTGAGLHQVLTDAIDILPGLAEATVLETRVGFRPGSRDGLPILGTVGELPGVVVATGLGAEGLTLGPYQGVVAARLAMGEEAETDLVPFRPDREVPDAVG